MTTSLYKILCTRGGPYTFGVKEQYYIKCVVSTYKIIYNSWSYKDCKMKVPELEEQQGRNIYLSRSEYLSTTMLP